MTTSFNGISPEELKQRVLCIGGFAENSLWLTRLFSSEEAAVAARDKLHNAHGNSIITWIRSLNKREMNSVFGFGEKYRDREFDVIDDDSLLIEVIRVSIGLIPMDAPTDMDKIVKKIHLDFHAHEALLACADLETLIEEKNKGWHQTCHWFWANEGRRVTDNKYMVTKLENTVQIANNTMEVLQRRLRE